MRQILLPVAGEPTISIAFSFRVGSQDDPPGKEGLASLTAAMLTQGATEKLRYEAILERLYPLAASYSATVDKEMTTIDGRVHQDRLDTFVELMTDAVLRPAFRDDDFARLKADAVNFIGSTLRYSSDEELGKAALVAAAFAGTRYAHPVAGTLAGLGAITLEDVRTFYREHYTQASLTLGVAGGFDPSLLTRLQTGLVSLPAGTPRDVPAVAATTLPGRRVALIDKPGADASISFGFPLRVSRGDRAFYALWLANSWLGEHRHTASHLYQVIREARGLNYGDYSYIEAFPHGGWLQKPPVNVARRRQLFEVWIRTLPNDQAVFALRAALREVDRLIAQGLTPDEFGLTRKFLTKYVTHFAPTTAARLGYAIDDAFYGIEGDGHLARFGATMQSLTLDEVNAAIREHWQLQNLSIAIVTGDADGLARALASNEPTPITYANPVPESIVREDAEIASYPLDIAAIERQPVASIFG